MVGTHEVNETEMNPYVSTGDYKGFWVVCIIVRVNRSRRIRADDAVDYVMRYWKDRATG